LPEAKYRSLGKIDLPEAQKKNKALVFFILFKR